MGLDMYLTKKTYVKNWEHKDGVHQVSVEFNGEERDDIKPERICHIVEDVMQWRKANHIHNWFVVNCQGGVDECQEVYVSREQLLELADLCERVVNEKNPKLMPTVQGFFFGSTEHDQYYYDYCTVTHETIHELLKEETPKGAYEPQFYYQSSW